MGWTIYVKKNREGMELLKIITREPAGSYSGVIKSIEVAGFWDNDSYMVQKKKKIKGTKKILYTIVQEKKRRAPPPRAQPRMNYSMQDYELYTQAQALRKDDSDNEKDTAKEYKESLMKRAQEMQEKRQKTIKPASRPSEEEISKEVGYPFDEDPQEGMEKFFDDIINSTGRD